MPKPTIVLVHGAWHGSWCWENVRSQLEGAGFTVIAVDLPGHEVPGSSRRKWNTLSSYVEHVRAVVNSTEGDVVLVGHSMGGLVSQRLLETQSVAGTILVASAPLRGVFGVVARLVRRDPAQFLSTFSLSLWALVENDKRVREHFFTGDTDDATVAHTGTKLQNESYPAFLSMLTRWPRPEKVNAGTTPISVVAAQHDGIFTLDEQRSLAAAYDTEITIIDSGHDIMLDGNWPELVDHISEWIKTDVSPDTD